MIQTTERSNKRKIRTLSAFFVSFSPFRGARFTICRNCGVRLGRRAKRKRGRRPRVRGVRRNFCLHYEPNCTFTRGRYRETMQDTRANMGAHLKWDIPMFLGIASTKDGRARAPIMSSTRRDISLSRLRKAFVSPRNLSSRAPLFFFSSLLFLSFFPSSLR